MIKRYNEYINEGVRDQMTPKPSEDINKMLDDLFKQIENQDILDKLEILNNKKVLRYLDKKRSMKLISELLNNYKEGDIQVTGQNDEFYLFENKTGNGMFIFNKNNLKFYHTGLFALKEVVGALNYLL